VKPLLLTFDVEEFDLPLELGHPLSATTQIRVTARGLRRVLPLLRRHEVVATFFVTGEFARQRPALVARLAAEGHEVGVHGLEHRDDYASLPAPTAIERLRRARALVQEAAGGAADGVRTPRLRRCAAEVLHDAGFAYDASPHPTWMPGRYNGLRLSRRPWHEGGLWHLPISVLPGLRLPVSWIWYRAAGSLLGNAAVRVAGIGAPYVHLYFHPWEAVPLRALGVPAILALRSGQRFLALLDGLLGGLAGEVAPMTTGDFARRLADRCAGERP
jgi:peptidoglycan/xylan/chitin deacetylase (PgdA/CDA1 family)